MRFVQAVTNERQLQTLAQHLRQIDRRLRNAPPAMTHAPGEQYLFDSFRQSIAIGEHDVVERLPLLRVDVARLECREIKANRSERRLEFVGNRVDERVVLLIAANLANQKRRVDDQPEDEQVEEDDAEREQRDLRPVEND